MKLGDYNRLTATRDSVYGFYLDTGEGREILLPKKYVPAGLAPGDTVEVFVYRDSDDREIATTQRPLAKVGDFAYLQVCDVNDAGIFLDWGLDKHLYMPYSQAHRDMRKGLRYVVFVMLDHVSRRIVASAKFEKFVEKKEIALREGQEVKLLVCRFTPNGIMAIVDNRYAGILYENETFERLRIGDAVTGYVKKVRADNKIDLTLRKSERDAVGDAAARIMAALEAAGGAISLNDKSSPEDIKNALHISKMTFKKAAGALYKERRIVIGPDGIRLAPAGPSNGGPLK